MSREPARNMRPSPRSASVFYAAARSARIGPFTDRQREPHDGVAVDARHPLRCSDARAVHERTEDREPLLARQHVRHGFPCLSPAAGPS